MNKLYFFRIVLIIVAGLSFVIAHEFGHYIAAASFDLDPVFIVGNIDSGANLLSTSVGVSHTAAATASQDFIIILSATLLPIAIIIGLLGAAAVTGMEEFTIIAEIYFILIIMNLVPVPGIEHLDSNKMWSHLLGLSF